MFGKNEIVGAGYFKDQAGKDTLTVTSMFMTLQGEGPFRGEPAFFIRLAKCQLACSFCDTYFDAGDVLSFEEINVKIERAIRDFYQSKGIPRPEWTQVLNDPNTARGVIPRKMVLVITGGEPMLQDNLAAFLQGQESRWQNMQIESNGIRIVPGLPESVTVVCSPKCLEKNGVATKYLTPSKAMLERADCLKFVMTADPDSPYSVVPQWAHDWRNQTGKNVFVSPMNVYNDEPAMSKQMRLDGTNDIDLETRSTVDEVISAWAPGLLNQDENEKNHTHVGLYCVTHGFIAQMQIHLYMNLA